MNTSPAFAPQPLVSVILPTYNRRTFLRAAFEAIAAQGIAALEVVVVDDGSSDDTKSFVRERLSDYAHPIRYIYQENQGAYGARNTGVAAARGTYLAFYDSDDVWLPHHLPTCIAALDAHDDVDWVYAACELVDFATQAVLEPSSFYEHGRGRPFLRLKNEARGTLRVITDHCAIRCQIDAGLFCGLQNSVLRRSVFERLAFEAETRNEAEDQLFAIRALAAGFRLGYIDNVHVRYQIHGSNSSAPGQALSLMKRRRVYEPLVAGYERLSHEVALTRLERRALRRRISHDLFWHLGYNGFWAEGERLEALELFRRALRVWPWNLLQWKTFILAVLRSAGNRTVASVENR
jgi:glycosyltransferase involved in cell wall biosynthesis